MNIQVYTERRSRGQPPFAMSPVALNCSGPVLLYLPNTEDFTKAKISTIVVDVVVCLVYIVTVAFIIFLETYRRFLTRLLLYLIVVILFHTISDAIKMAAFQVSNDVTGTPQLQLRSESVCTATAFFEQFFHWLGQLVLCGMTFHIFSLSVCQKDMHTRCREIVAIVAAITVTLLFSAVPFIPINGSKSAYGWHYGFTCWIRTINITSCDLFPIGILEQLVLWYIWFAITSIYMIVSLILSIRALYRQFRMESEFSRKIQYKQALKEAVALLVYIAIFIILSLVDIVYESWIVQAIVNPSIFLLIPTAFLLHPATSKRLRCSELRKAAKRWKRRVQGDDTADSETNFIVSNEFSEEGMRRLVIRGTSGCRYNERNYTALETIANRQVPTAP